VTSRSADDRLDARLGGLSSMAPDSTRADRVRARCQARLANRVSRTRTRRLIWKRVVAPALVGGFCAVYFAVMLYDVFGPAAVGGGL
jgi:hypothetical protein